MNDKTITVHLTPEPLTANAFAPFGNVIETSASANNQMNSGTFERFDNLATIATNGTQDSIISMVRSEIPATMPHRFTLVEKHPLCSQAFIPRTDFVFYVVVGVAGDSVSAQDLKAFVSNGRQGISYFPGTWHMPLIALEREQEFIVVDQAALPGNLVELTLEQSVTLNPA